jgi:hypothetical protein
VVTGALVVLFALGVVVTRAFWDGRRALAAGDAAVARGDSAEAVTQWRRAARWYLPGAPHVADAYARLEAIALEADAHGDTRLALDAWRAVRSSVLATRSFYTPFPLKLTRANDRIADLMAKQEVAQDPEKAQQQGEIRSFHLGLLLRDEAPSVPWTLVALLGFAAWVGGGFWFARRGVTAEDKLDRKTAARAGLLILGGLLLWMLGLYRA